MSAIQAHPATAAGSLVGEGDRKGPPARPSTRPPGRPSSAPPRGLRSSHPPPPRRISARALRIAPIDYDLANAARRVVESALGTVAGETIVLIVDEARRELGATLAEVARVAGARPVLFELETLGARPFRYVPDPVRAALQTAQASVLLIGFDDSELGMRFELVGLAKTLSLRHAHMVGVTRASMIAGLAVDPARILDATRAVRTRLQPSSVLRLRTAAGSDLVVKTDPACRWAEHVGVIRPGKWENLPAGEIVTCPLDVRGVFVADASIGGHFGQAAGLLAPRPVRVEIEGGVCKSVRCGDLSLQRDVEHFLRSEINGDRVGTISIGTNVGMHTPIGDVLCDQNLPGLHVGFGSTFAEQTGATWDARIQVTMACANADVDLDGAALLRQGRYLVT
jgi:aminopeptidase